MSGSYKGKGKYVKLSSWDRKTFRSYLATPPGRKGPGILLCQEIFGINDHIREVADQYAEEGYFVLAPRARYRARLRGGGLQEGLRPLPAARSRRLATAWAASSPILPPRGPGWTQPSATTASISRRT